MEAKLTAADRDMVNRSWDPHLTMTELTSRAIDFYLAQREASGPIRYRIATPGLIKRTLWLTVDALSRAQAAAEIDGVGYSAFIRAALTVYFAATPAGRAPAREEAIGV